LTSPPAPLRDGEGSRTMCREKRIGIAIAVAQWSWQRLSTDVAFAKADVLQAEKNVAEQAP
jgi:hypothetical protein